MAFNLSFVASSAIATSAVNLRPPAMATTATAAPSGHLFGLDVFAYDPSLIQWLRVIES